MSKRSLFFFPKYNQDGASSRYRIYQYLIYYTKLGYACETFSFFPNGYIQKLNTNERISRLYFLRALFARVYNVLFQVNKGTIVYIQAELVPYFPSIIFELYLKKIRKAKIVLDFDDAIFHNYDLNENFIIRKMLGTKISNLISVADVIITGSPYLSKFARKYNDNVFEIPTSISMTRYSMPVKHRSNKNFIIGWIGSSSTSGSVMLIKKSIQEFQSKYPDSELRLVGFNSSLQKELEGLNVSYLKWDGTKELEYIKSFDVGIMPLENTPWSNGKCGFKLIQYMASGKVTISTPLEANIKINRHSFNLFANSNAEWFQAFEKVYSRKAFYIEVGLTNRKIVSDHYSTEVNAQKYVTIFDTLHENNK